MPQTSSGWSLDRNDGLHILKVLGYSVASAIVAAGLTFVTQIHVPSQYLFIVPLVNAVLVAIQRLIASKQQ